MQSFAEALKAYTRDHPFDAGNGDAETVLDQLYQAYAESHESDPPEISEGFKELECFLETLPLDDNNAVFNLCCRLCTAYEEKAFRHGLIYGAHLMQELNTGDTLQAILISVHLLHSTRTKHILSQKPLQQTRF